MYSSNQTDYQKFNPSPSPPSAPPAFEHSKTATGIPVTSANEFYSANRQQPPVHQNHLGAQETPWSSGLCDCGSDVSNCCITCWCPCITFGQISEIVDRGSSSCVANGAIYALLALFTGCGCIYSCLYRSKMRNQYKLKEGPCGDCLLHFCCEACALCQEYRELQNRGFNVPLGWEANVERQNQGVAMAPVVQAGMNR